MSKNIITILNLTTKLVLKNTLFKNGLTERT